VALLGFAALPAAGTDIGAVALREE